MTAERQQEFDQRIREIRNEYPDSDIEYWSPSDVDALIEGQPLPDGIDREDVIGEVMEILRESHDASSGTGWGDVEFALNEAVERLQAE
jgi:hypothetical protein